MSWKNVDTGLGKACFKRSDGALVMEVRLFVFEATAPDAGILVTKKGKRRTWSTPEGAMSQVDKEYPINGVSPEPKVDLEAVTDQDYQRLLHDAAHAIAAAVKAHTGRVRPVDAWKSTAARVLGVSRLYSKRWNQVLDQGVELGLFEINNRRYSYPVIDLLEPKPQSAPEPEPEPQSTAHPQEERSYNVPELPENWEPPTFMDCGHSNAWLEPDGTCRACTMKVAPNWMKLRGAFLRPIPVDMRRTTRKIDQGGFEGYCCDREGYYIGGIFNDCRRTDGSRCEVHE